MSYKNAKIYKIVSSNRDDCYIGSTTQEIQRRFVMHKHQHNPCLSRKIIEAGDASIELIEEFPCNNRNELERREGFHIRNNKCINKYVAGRTALEYRMEHKEHKRLYDKAYRLKKKGMSLIHPLSEG